MSSRPRKWLRRSGLALLVVFVLIQLKQPQRTNPPIESALQAPPEIAAILERSCYDCHSHQTQWPWYAYVAPISWRVAEHVEHGRGDLNFSRWPVLDFEELEHSFRDIDEQLAKDEMPLKDYLLLHPSARLSEDDKIALRRWAKSNF